MSKNWYCIAGSYIVHFVRYNNFSILFVMKIIYIYTNLCIRVRYLWESVPLKWEDNSTKFGYGKIRWPVLLFFALRDVHDVLYTRASVK